MRDTRFTVHSFGHCITPFLYHHGVHTKGFLWYHLPLCPANKEVIVVTWSPPEPRWKFHIALAIPFLSSKRGKTCPKAVWDSKWLHLLGHSQMPPPCYFKFIKEKAAQEKVPLLLLSSSHKNKCKRIVQEVVLLPFFLGMESLLFW